MGNQGIDITHSFRHENELNKAMVKSIIHELKNAIIDKGSASLLLSGGNTPGPLYRLLDKECEFLNKIKFGLVDERYVPLASKFSNEKYIRNCFSRYPSTYYQIIGMVTDPNDKKRNLEQAQSNYQEFAYQTDVVILGMGKDGHIASIFPGDQESEIALSTLQKGVFNTKAPSEPKNRITCGMKLITNANSIYLLFHGNDKRKVLFDESKSLPIHNLIQQRKDIKLFYLDDDK